MADFVRDLATDLLNAIKVDMAKRDPIFHRGHLKKESIILCKVRPTLMGSGAEISLFGDVGERVRAVRYDDEFLNEFIEFFTDTSKSFKAALEQVSQKSSPYFVGEPLLGSLYLTLFCRKVASDYLANEELTEGQVKELVGGFTRDLEGKTLGISAKVGVKGVVATEEISIRSQFADAIIRPPKLDDLPSEIVVPDRWEGEMDIRNHPSIPTFCSVIEVFPREMKVVTHPGGIIMMPKMYDSNQVFDWFIGAVYPEFYKLTWLLILFQSKYSLQFRSANVRFYLKNLSAGPAYEKSIPVAENQVETQSFPLTPANKGNLLMFWDQMRRANFTDRIYGRSDTKESLPEHHPRPLEIAFKRYMHILSVFEEPKVRIHDTLEAIEGFFTPEEAFTRDDFEKYRKIFIPRVSSLVGLFEDLDPNDTNWTLNMGFRIRSDYSHRSSGWEETDELAEESEIELRRKHSELEFQNGLSQLLLNYLRICLVSRVLAGVPDREFVHLLDTEKGRGELKRLLAGLDHLVRSDPLVYVDRGLVRCSLCWKEIPWLYFSRHIEEKHQDELRRIHGTLEFDAVLDHAYEILDQAISKSLKEKKEVTDSELRETLTSIDPLFAPERYFVPNIFNFVSLIPGRLYRRKEGPYSEFVYRLASRQGAGA